MSSKKFSIRPLLVYCKWTLERLPFILLYRLALWFKLPLKKQVEWLPPPQNPPVFWTYIDHVNMYGSLKYPPIGRWCTHGDWDIKQVHPLPSIFEEIPKNTKKWEVHETIRTMFIYKKKYRKTPQYKMMVSAVSNGSKNPPQGCDTIEEVDHYFRRLKKAYKSMKKEGYLTQNQLGRPSVEEIRLHITRDGELCLGTGGNHRIRMAEILGIKSIPFLLRGIHREWVIQLSQEYSLPPHKAIEQWLNTSSIPIYKKPPHNQKHR